MHQIKGDFMKVLWHIENDKYLIILKQKDDEMKINFEGADLYFVMYNYHEDNKFVIGKDNDLYAYFKNLFNDIRINDDSYNKIINDNKFIWISEDYGEYENANRLTITELDNSYIIQFYNNPNKIFGNAKVCPICFCLSGSKNQNIANLFAIMFNNIISEKCCNKILKKCYEK